MTDQQDGPPPQGQQFTSGFDFTNHHLNLAMRYTERAMPTEDKHIGHQTAFKLAAQHTELARVGALATIAQQLQNLANVHGEAVGTLAGVLHEAFVFPRPVPDAMDVPLVDTETGRDGAETLLDRQDGPRPPVTRFQRRLADREQQDGPQQ